MEYKDHYDYLVVGAGLYGSVCAYRIGQAGKTCLVVDKRKETGGNLRCEDWHGITVHKYGPHIFHTDSDEVWRLVNSITPFRQYVHSPVAKAENGKIYSMPFNMWTFNQVWGCQKPSEAGVKISESIDRTAEECDNLEDAAVSMVGRDIYELLVKSYTEKQWGRKCVDLPASTIKRLPIRMTYSSSYFNDKYQAIPELSYNSLIEGLLSKADVMLCRDYNSAVTRAELNAKADKVIYTGALDEYFSYSLGELEYRSLRFETSYIAGCGNEQGAAIVNYTGPSEKYTRIIEHKHFTPWRRLTDDTALTYEYPQEWDKSKEQCYPICDEKNLALYKKYEALADKIDGFYFGGRLADYKYYDMDDAIEAALKLDIGL